MTPLPGEVPRRRVLFITHDASRTGAPISLLHLLRWLGRSSSLTMTVVAGEGGPLVREFEAVAPTVVLSAPRLVEAVVRRLPGGPALKRRLRSRLARRRTSRLAPYDLVYANTVMSVRLLPFLDADVPVVTHVHELEQWIESRLAPGEVESLLRRSDRMIATSDAVRENLIAKHGVDPKHVVTVQAFIDVRAVPARPSRKPGVALRVGGAGTLDARKGPDLFVRVAAAMRWASQFDLRFTWIGGDLNAPFARQVRSLTEELGVADAVTFTGQVADPLVKLSDLDLFLLTSREEPFGMAMLEAAAAGVPTVCFDLAGGAPAFVGDDAGVVVPHLDVDAMAAAALALLADPPRLAAAGQRALEKVRARADVEVAGARILEVIEAVAPAYLKTATCPADNSGMRPERPRWVPSLTQLTYSGLVRLAGAELPRLAGLWDRGWAAAWRRLSGPVQTTMHGRKVTVNAGYVYPAFMRRWRTYNDPLVELVHQAHVAKGAQTTLVDVGAAVGDTVLLVLERCPGAVGNIHCIEGDAEFFGYLQRNLGNLSQVHLHNALVSDAEGEERSLVRVHTGTASAQGDSRVPATTLDAILASAGSPDVDVLKIDTDGFDGKVLAGATNLLHEGRPAVIFEWSPPLLHATGQDRHRPFEVLTAAGYQWFVWFNKYGVFSHVEDSYRPGPVDVLADLCLSDRAPGPDWHYDVVALPEGSPISPTELSALTHARRSRGAG